MIRLTKGGVMHIKRAIGIFHALVFVLVMAFNLSPKLAGQQPPHCAQNLFCLFNQEAAAPDPAGIHRYSEDLIGLIVLNPAGEDSIRHFSAVLAVTAVMLPPLDSQFIIQEGSPTMSHPVPLLDALSKEAEVADTPKGAEAYSMHLINLLVGNQMGDDFVSTQASRLATVDLLARRGEREYVDESSVADAFNELMKKVRGLGGKAFMTDAASVHRLRLGISRASPALTTVSVHASSCLPSEALFLIVLLITNNGTIGEPLPPGSAPELRGTTGRRVSANAEARLLLVNFLRTHPHSKDVRLFDVLAKYVGF